MAVSAATGEGIDDFLATLADRLRTITTPVELLIPYERGDVLAAVHREGEVVSSSHEEGGVRVRARLADASAGRLSEFVVAGDDRAAGASSTGQRTSGPDTAAP